MVGLEALIAGVLGGKTLLKVGKEDPSLGTGFGMVKALQQGSKGGVGSVAGLLALLKELIHRRRHFASLEVSSQCRCAVRMTGQKRRGKQSVS